jgi:NAD(P)-dependent dehydrogenase (short-subunit alcohol dehydrogenase family)
MVSGIRDLRDKVAVVTGAASGMGRAFAERFAAEGMKVVLADIEEALLKEAVEQIRATGAEAIGVRADVRFEEQVQALADRTMAQFGAVHVVCNNAGVETGAQFADIPVSAWKWVLDVNLWGAIYGCRIFLPLIRQSGGEGHIVNTGSLASFGAPPLSHPYTASKHALLGLSESLELELRRNGEKIGVSLIGAGFVRTNMTDSERNRPDDVPDTRQAGERGEMYKSMSALNADGLDPADVAEMVVEAIHQRRLYILTHPELATAAAKARLAWMETGEPAENRPF